MNRTRVALAALGLAVLVPAVAPADGLEAGGMEFPATVSVKVGEEDHELRCTGTAVRKKFFFKVYAAAGYLDTAVDTGDDPGAAFVAADAPKRMHLHMLRGVDSEKITSSINEALEKCSTEPLGPLAAERERFLAAFSMEKLEDGQDIRFTWIPGAGLEISVDNALLDTIESPAFAKAFFEIYFGPKPVNGGMKDDLLELEREG